MQIRLELVYATRGPGWKRFDLHCDLTLIDENWVIYTKAFRTGKLITS